MKNTLAYSAIFSLALIGVPSAFAQNANEPAETEEIVITGVRASLVEGLEVKREATQVVESIVAEDIGKLPDNNVVEALQRIAGVQVTDRGAGEADAVVIRGLPDVTTTWNGRSVFTTSGRQLALADIPANLINRVDVYKTRAAEQIETGLAGQIDVQTRRPFDFDGLQFALSARAISQEERETTDPNVSVLISNRWQTSAGEFGAMFNVSYGATRYRDQSVTAGAMVPFATADNPPPGYVPLERIFPTRAGVAEDPIWQAGLDRGLPSAPGSTLDFNGVAFPYLLSRDALFASDLRGDRERPAVVAALQWAPNPSSTYTFEFFYQGYREELFNNLHFTFADWWGSLGPDPGSTITLFPGTNIIRTRTVGAPFGFNSGDSTYQNTDSFVYALNGDWELGERLSVTADLAYQTSEFETEFIAMRTERVPASLTLDFNPGDGIPSWQFNDPAEMLDPNVWTAAQLFQNRQRDEGDAVTLSVDGDYDADLDDNDFFRRLSFGLRYDDRGASEADVRSNDNPVPFLGGSFGALPAGLHWRNSGFFSGLGDVPSGWVVPNGYYLRDNAAEIRALYGLPTGSLPLTESFNVDERTIAAYVQADMALPLLGRDLRAQVGVRYVNVETPMDFTDLNAPTPVSSSTEQQTEKFLPSITLIYDLTDDLRVRFNYGQTLRRPDFIALNPNFNLTTDLTEVGYGSGTGGNPDLEATEATNYDFTIEWYFANDSAIYGTVFRREIEGLVVPLTRRITIPGTGLTDPSGDPVTEFVVTQPVNASNGELEGIEIGLVYFPDYLPGLLDGLGVQASYTQLESSQNIPLTNSAGEIIGQDTSSFFDVSDTSYNVTGVYERGGLGMRLSYVWRDNFLNNNEARIFANPIGIWRQPESSLDFQATYDLNERLTFTLDATNLTEELQQSYYAFADAGGPDTHNFGTTIISRTFALGLRYRMN